MATAPRKAPEFIPVSDPKEIVTDPLLSRMMACFDALRRRGVGPDQASRSVAQVFVQGAAFGAHPVQDNTGNFPRAI